MRNPVSLLLGMLQKLRRTKPEPVVLPSILYATDRFLQPDKQRQNPKQHESIW